MASEPRRALQLEIAHVLLMDFVEYSRLPMTEQTQQLGQLQDLLRGTTEFRRAESSGELICLPTGDGMALVFFRDPVAPVQCAIELAQGGLTLNGNTTLRATVIAPNGTVILNGNSTLTGRVSADSLTLNGNSLLEDPAL